MQRRVSPSSVIEGLFSSRKAAPKHRHTRGRQLETLEPRQVMASDVVISELMAFNQSGLKDEDNTVQDWIELYNSGSSPVNLASWSLTDDPLDLDKWNFPNVTIAPKAFLVVFASGKDLRVPTANLHTDFALNKDGGYLALVQADNVTIANEFDTYPAQAPDVSFGFNT